ncbi:hypothetical protein [Rhodococcus pyridinivorans]|uniref:hypothetical protein n=1 Tax=Rhodococcus pyridinivorans TaxID=103816 RepID=UPI00228530A5|nr:hypothetical protein [Rhodococcus pyridinivorans]WAL45707.1 hypothetical protein OQN32_19950 [Rhodococcus pyridinivorans]
MSERLLVGEAADTVQFQRVEDGTSRRRARTLSSNNGGGSERLQASADRSSSKRIVFKERKVPDLWFIAGIAALVTGVAVLVGGVVASQARDSAPTYQSVYVPENVLGGSQR